MYSQITKRLRRRGRFARSGVSTDELAPGVCSGGIFNGNGTLGATLGSAGVTAGGLLTSSGGEGADGGVSSARIAVSGF